MEIIRIGNDKLKLILTEGDLAKYSLKPEGCRYDNTETRRVLWQILDEAKKETGFDAAAERTLVQAYPGRRGGCEIYVTRVAPHSHASSRETLYRFDEIDSLLSVAKQSALHPEITNSMLYKADGGYYLLLLTKKDSKESPFSSLSFIEEYAERMKGDGFLSYIKEHGECLWAQDALKQIEKFTAYVYKKGTLEEQ